MQLLKNEIEKLRMWKRFFVRNTTYFSLPIFPFFYKIDYSDCINFAKNTNR